MAVLSYANEMCKTYYDIISCPLDSRWHTAGSPITHHHTEPDTPDTISQELLYILPQAEFREDGELVALEVMATQSGDAFLAVSNQMQN